jgi:hypothetical protein
MNLQGPEAQDAKILQSQNRHRAKIRLPVNGLRVVHGRLKLVADLPSNLPSGAGVELAAYLIAAAGGAVQDLRF